eukprot:RCo013726
MSHRPLRIFRVCGDPADQHLEAVPQVAHLALALPELRNDHLALVFDGLHLQLEQVFMHRNLRLSLLDGDLQLGLAVLQREQALAGLLDVAFQAADLQLEHVVVYQQHLLLLRQPPQLQLAGLVFESEVQDAVVLGVLDPVLLVDQHLALPHVVRHTLHLQVQNLVLLLQVIQHGLKHVDLLLELLLFLLGTLAAGPVHLTLHLLDLELDIVQQLVLLEGLLVELCDLGLHVLVLGLRSRDFGEVVGLGLAHSKQLLGLLVVLGLQCSHLLLKLPEAVLCLRQHVADQLGLLLHVPRSLGLLLQLQSGALVVGHHLRVLGVALLQLLIQRGPPALARVEVHSGFGQGVLHHFQLIIELPQVLRDQEVVLAVLRQHTLLLGDLVLHLLVVLHLDVQEGRAVLKLLRALLVPGLSFGELLPSLLDGLVSSMHCLNGFLPLLDQVLSLGVQRSEVLRGLVQLDLGGLGLSDLLFELLLFLQNIAGELLEGQSELLDLRIIGAVVLEQRERVVLLLLPGKVPLLQLLLVEAHLALELIHFQVALENGVLNVVELFLDLHLLLRQRLYFRLYSASIALRQLSHVVLRLRLPLLRHAEILDVLNLHVYVREVLRHEGQPLLVIHDLLLLVLHLLLIEADLLLQLPVFLVKKGVGKLVQAIGQDVGIRISHDDEEEKENRKR